MASKEKKMISRTKTYLSYMTQVIGDKTRRPVSTPLQLK